MVDKPTPIDGSVEKVELTPRRKAILAGICAAFAIMIAVMLFGGK